jgi:hypothetical protein
MCQRRAAGQALPRAKIATRRWPPRGQGGLEGTPTGKTEQASQASNPNLGMPVRSVGRRGILQLPASSAPTKLSCNCNKVWSKHFPSVTCENIIPRKRRRGATTTNGGPWGARILPGGGQSPERSQSVCSSCRRRASRSASVASRGTRTGGAAFMRQRENGNGTWKASQLLSVIFHSSR